MADKKSFVMYMSWAKAISKMTDEQAGQLLKAVYEYQTNPDACPEDAGADLVFEIVKERMDEDNAKYQKICESRSEAGKKGMSSRYNKNEEAVTEENGATEEASDDDTEGQIVTKANKAQQKVTNVTDTDTEADTDKDKKKKEKEKPLKRPSSRSAVRGGKAERNAALFERLADGRGYSEAVSEKLREWMRYKGNAQGDEYEETGVSSLLSILDKNLREHGEEAVLAEITEAMGNGWKGIQWNRLARPQPRQWKGGAPNRFNNFTQPDPGYEELAKEKLKQGMPFGG